MKSGYKLTLGILTIMIMITLTIGTSYSYYSVTATQEEENNLATSCFNVEFSNESEAIYLPNTYPMSEANALKKVTPYSLTITNTCSDVDINYVTTLSTLTGKTDLVPYLNYKIVEAKPSAADGNYAKLTGAQPYNGIPEEYKTGVEQTYEIDHGVLDATNGRTKTFYLYLWLDENACDNDAACSENLMGKSFEGRVLVYVYV